MLVVLNLDRKIRMEANVSDYAIGGVLYMECEDGRWRLVVIVYLNSSILF